MERVPTTEGEPIQNPGTLLVDGISIAALTAILLLLRWVEPFHQKITEQLEPIKPVIVSTLMCIVLSVVIPAIASLVITRSIRFATSITIGALLVSVFTDAMKLFVGELRPDFSARCQLKDNVCTGDPEMVRQGRLSFPSGHSSLAFFGLLLFSMFLHRHLNPALNPTSVIIASSSAMLLAVYIGVSRYLHFDIESSNLFTTLMMLYGAGLLELFLLLCFTLSTTL